MTSKHYLESIFRPETVAIFGASEKRESVGGTLFENLIRNEYVGKVYPVNPKYKEIAGRTCYPSVEEIPTIPSLALIATGAAYVPSILETCGRKGIRSAVILSAGFREVGAQGKALEDEVLSVAKRYGIRFLGPNTLGIMRPSIGFNATFYRGRVRQGRTALVSQSGALCTSILDWAEKREIGFSSVISLGIGADVDFGEILDFLTLDTETDHILLYIEGIQKPRRFMSALRAAARMKPVIALKVGRFEAGSKAAISHTGALVGSDKVFDTVFRRAGVVRVDTTAQLFAAVDVLSISRRVEGNQLAIVTNGGGPGVLAADAAMEKKITLANFNEETFSKLNQVLPPQWSHSNPIDVLGDATPQRYQSAIEIVAADSNVHGILVILTPQAMTNPTEVAENLVEASQKTEKPILAAWMGGAQVEKGREILTQNNIPCFEEPVLAMEAFSYLVQHHRNQKLLLQVPNPLSDRKDPDLEGARMIIESVTQERRSVLSQIESKALLSCFHIPIAPAVTARSAQEALLAAEEMGFPVTMKICSHDITHKSDVGGVRLNLANAHSVRSAYQEMVDSVLHSCPEARIDGVTIEPMIRRKHSREVMIGATTDPVFGPVISFGMGGTMVEVLRDSELELPPLNEVLINRLIDRTKASRLLQAFRQYPKVDQRHLHQIFLRVSEMICELPEIEEMDLNPILATPDEAIVLDARVVVKSKAGIRPYSHLAIHPYPSNLVQKWQLPDGREIEIRPIRPEDAMIERTFVNSLSEESKYFRFMGSMHEISQAMIVRFTQIDYDRDMAFIATHQTNGQEEQIAVGRYSSMPNSQECEFALVVGDAWQRKGIGRRIMEELIQVARSRGLRRMRGDVLSQNQGMLRLVRGLGFDITVSKDDPKIMNAEMPL